MRHTDTSSSSLRHKKHTCDIHGHITIRAKAKTSKLSGDTPERDTGQTSIQSSTDTRPHRLDAASLVLQGTAGLLRANTLVHDRSGTRHSDDDAHEELRSVSERDVNEAQTCLGTAVCVVAVMLRTRISLSRHQAAILPCSSGKTSTSHHEAIPRGVRDHAWTPQKELKRVRLIERRRAARA